MSDSQTNSSRYLTFSLGNEQFAIPLLQVKEVIALNDVTPVPQTPAYFLGIMNLRGQVITILDLRTKMGIKPKSEVETVVIICDLKPLCVGVVVDTVNSVIPVQSDQISPKPDLTGSKVDSITGVYQDEGNLILILDVAKTLNLSDQSIAQRIQSSHDSSKRSA